MYARVCYASPGKRWTSQDLVGFRETTAMGSRRFPSRYCILIEVEALERVDFVQQFEQASHGSKHSGQATAMLSIGREGKVKLKMGIMRSAKGIPTAHHPAMLLYQGQTSLVFHMCARDLSGQTKSPDAYATSFAGWGNGNTIGPSSTLARLIAV